MFRLMIAVSALALLSACDGDGTQPFDFDETVEEDAEEDAAGDPEFEGEDGDGAGGGGNGAVTTDGGGLPSGTSEPNAAGGIIRFETEDGQGGGFLRQPVTYNSQNDTIVVNNLAFDGANVYRRDDQVPTMGGYAVYEAAISKPDFLTGNQVQDIRDYRAIVGFSRNNVEVDGAQVPRTSFAIVRTGGYVNYGFGGFVYSRNGGVVLPERVEGQFAGQAVFDGRYGGIRVFQDRGGLEFTRGDVTLQVDFDDFDANRAVSGTIDNREAFGIDGTPIRLGTGDDDLKLPPLLITVDAGENVGLDDNGEMTGELGSFLADENGNLEAYETGQYYAILAGDTTDPNDGGEIVGIFVVESTDPRFDVTVQETGGFIVYR